MIKPLLRIIPSYSGNIKISCELSDYTHTKTIDTTDIYECRVRGAVLDSASDSLSRKKISCNLLGSSYDYDLKTFYTYNKDVFFDSGFQYNSEEIQKIDRTVDQPTRNQDVEYGCKRISYKKEGNQLEFFAPIYIDSEKSLPSSFNIEVRFNNSQYNKSKIIKVVINEEETKQRNYNYLYTYLKKYAGKVDDKVATISTYSNSLILYGVDLNNGGMCTATDTCVANLLQEQQTINNFDATIASSYKRNHIVMKQVLPLAFQFNLSKVLSNDEKSLLMNSIVNISGYYDIDGNQLPLFDFSADYNNYSEDVLKMDEETGLLKWVSGNVSNLMDDSFPSLTENRIQAYQFSNKLTKMYTRWKVAQSTDDHPYIANTSFAFNRNQEDNIKYGQYPKSASNIRALAKEMESDTSNYSLMFPLGDDNEYFDGGFSDIPQEYQDSVERYQFNWFDIQDGNDIVENVEWGDVIQGKCYYKGILHNIDKLTAQSKESPVIDKFAVILQPVIANVIDNSNSGSFAMPTFTILTESADYYSKNAFVNPQIVLKGVGLGDDTANWIYGSENSSSTNAQIVTGNIYTKQYPDSSYSQYYTKTSYAGTYAYLPDQYSRYIDPNEIGIDVDSMNEYYDGSLLCAYLNTLRKTLRYSNCINWTNEDKIEMSYQDVLIDAIQILQTTIDPILCVGNPAFDSLTYSYLIEGSELLSLYIPGILCNSYGYMVIPDNYSYTANTYILMKTSYDMYSTDDEDINWGSYTTNYARKNNKVMTITCGYGETPDWTHKYGMPSYQYDYANLKYNVFTSDVYYTDSWYDPIYDVIKASTASKMYPDDCAFKNYLDPSLSYIKIPEYPYSSYVSYQASIYNGSSYFVKRQSVDNFISNSVEDAVATYVSASSKYTFSYIGTPGTRENLLSYTMRSLHNHVSTYISSYCSNMSKYAFYPVLFNSGNPYITNVFVKKNEHETLSTTISQEIAAKTYNVLWLDVYNMTSVLEEYKANTGRDCVGLIDDKMKFKAKFLNKQHLYWWYTELAKDENLKQMKNIGENWSDHVYIRTKNLMIVGGKLEVKNCYQSIRTLSKIDSNFSISFKEFFDLITYDGVKDKWSLFNNPNKYIELAFDLYCFKVSKDLYGAGKLIDVTKSTSQRYKDLYIYRNETEDEWESSFIEGMESRYINPDVESLEGIEVDDMSCLVPMFNEIYEQELDDTQLYAIYKLEGLQEVKVVDDELNVVNTYQRYSQYNSNLLIELTDDTLEYLSEPIEKDEDRGWIKSRFEVQTGKVLNNLLWSNLSNNNIGFATDTDELGLGIDNVNTISRDGINYMYYKIMYKVDNSLSCMDLNAKSLMSSKDNPNEKYSTFIVKYVKYINEHNFSTDKEYIMKVFREMLPFMKINPNKMMSQIQSITPLTSCNFTNKYIQKLCLNTLDKKWQPSELTLEQNGTSDYSYKIERYFGDIVPYIVERTSISNQWYLKFKDVDAKLLEYGKYNSIGDSVLEHTTISISDVLPHYIYTISKDDNVKSYDNINTVIVDGEKRYDTHIPIEYKHFNNNKFFILPTSLTYSNPTYMTYDVLKEYETYEETMNVFKSLIELSNISDDEYIFLYNLYDVSYDTTPVKLNVYKDTKLWRLKYTFDLK